MLGISDSLKNPGHLTVGVVLAVQYSLEPKIMHDTVQYLDSYYDILRARFTKTGGDWHQAIMPVGEAVNFQHVDIAHLPEPERKGFIEQTVNSKLYTLDLASGPLYTVTLFTQGEGEPVYLAAYFHHVLMDAFSLNLYIGA